MKKTLTKISLLFTLACSISNIHSQTLYFGQPTAYSVPNLTAQVLDTGDFNNDGHLDIITSGGSIYGSNYNVFLNQGNGTFGTANSTAIENSLGLLVAGDFNNDNYTDFAIVYYRNLDIHLNNTTGGFTPPVSYSYGYNTALYDIAVGDFNGDGNKDIVLVETVESYSMFGGGDEQLHLQILTGNGTGAFTSQPSFQLPSDFGLSSNYTAPGATINVVADINKDGNDDLIIDNAQSNNVAVCYGNATTPLQSISQVSLTGLSAIYHADVRYGSCGQIVDLDANTWPDLVVILENNIFVYLNDGQGALSSPSTITVSSNNSFSSFFSSARAITIGKFNSDSRPDIATSDFGVILGNNNNSFSNTSAFSLNLGYWSIMAADFNGDGKDDIVGSDAEEIKVLLQTAAPVPSTPV